MKRSVGDLAVLGGMPEFDEQVHLGMPNLGDRQAFLERVGAVLDRGRLSNGGPQAREFESEVARVAGVDHCISTCNATTALQLAIRGFGLTGEVVVPSLTFAATAHAVSWLGLTPVFADIDPATCTVDARHVEQLVTPRTTGIIGVHLWGRVCDVAALEDVARRRRLTLLFDAAHAFGCTDRGRPVGGSGDAEVFSFHATKFVNALEGGAVVTNDAAAAQRMRSMHNFGIAGEDDVRLLGTNAKMNEVSAAMGLTSLAAMPGIVAHNARNHRLYTSQLAGLPGVRVLGFDDSERQNFQYVIVRVDPAQAGLTRDELLDVLRAERVHARRYFSPGCHRMPPYGAGPSLPHTERMSSQVLAMPTGTRVDCSQIVRMCRLLRLAIEHAALLGPVLRAAPGALAVA